MDNYKYVEALKMKIRDDNLPIRIVIKTLFHRDQLSTIVFTAVTKYQSQKKKESECPGN